MAIGNKGPREDLTGQVFGKLTVIKWENFSKRPTMRWLCRCECGNELFVATAMLKNGHTKTCRKCPRHKDFTGQVFGWLTAIQIDHIRINPNGSSQTMWKMLCKCGNYCIVSVSHLTDGGTKSCGCLQFKLSSPEGLKRAPRYNKAKTEEAKLAREIRHLGFYVTWRQEVLKAGNLKCSICGVKRSSKITIIAHHIVSLSSILNTYSIQSVEDAKNCEFLWDISNGLSLCKMCHKRVHNPYLLDVC